MSKLVIGLVIFVLGISLSLVGFEFYRESVIVQRSGLGLSRMSLKLFLKEEKSINFGADSRYILGFELPVDYSGLEMCGTNDYSEVRIVDVLEAQLKAVKSCSYRYSSESSSSYTYILLDNKVFVIILS